MFGIRFPTIWAVERWDPHTTHFDVCSMKSPLWAVGKNTFFRNFSYRSFWWLRWANIKMRKKKNFKNCIFFLLLIMMIALSKHQNDRWVDLTAHMYRWKPDPKHPHCWRVWCCHRYCCRHYREETGKNCKINIDSQLNNKVISTISQDQWKSLMVLVR